MNKFSPDMKKGFTVKYRRKEIGRYLTHSGANLLPVLPNWKISTYFTCTQQKCDKIDHQFRRFI